MGSMTPAFVSNQNFLSAENIFELKWDHFSKLAEKREVMVLRTEIAPDAHNESSQIYMILNVVSVSHDSPDCIKLLPYQN